MANTLEYLLKLNSGSFDGPMRSANSSVGKLKGSLAGIGAAGATAAGGMRTLSTATAGFAAVAAPVIAAVGAIVTVITSLGRAVSEGVNFESTSVAFENLIGDATLAKNTLQELVSFASQTPFELPDVQKAAQTLLGAGVAADKLNGSLNSLGNITSAFQADLSTVATIFAQVVNKGQLYAEEIQQFGENGIPALQLLSESMGKTKAEIIAAASAGELTASDLAAAFDKAGSAGGKFASAMQRQSQTTAGLWSTFKDSIGQIFRTLGAPVNDLIRPMLRVAIDLANKFGNALATAITIARNAVAQGQIGAALSNALTLGAKLGLNALIDGMAALPGKVMPFIVAIGQAIKAGLTGGWEEAKAILERSKFNLGGNMRFDTSSEMAFFRKLMGDAPGGAPGAAGGGGLADAIGKVQPAQKKEKEAKEKAAKEGADDAERGRKKIMGYSNAQWGQNKFLDHRSFGQFFSKERSQRLTPEWQNFFHGVPMPAGMEAPGKVTRRQAKKEAEAAAAKAVQPRWDLVEQIAKKLDQLTSE